MSQPELAYHRLYRSQPKYRWWKPLLALVLSGVLIVVVTSMLGVAALLAFVLLNGGFPTVAQTEALFTPDAAQPLTLVLSLVSVAIWIPLIFLSLWVVGIKPVGMLHSVALKLRWSRLGRYALVALGLSFLAQGISIAFIFLIGDVPEEWPQLSPLTVSLSLVAIIVFVPFQAAAEEYAFRGIFMQALGSWLKHPFIPIVLPTLLFTLAHSYDLWGMSEVLLMGITAAWLTYKTGGLEAAIALHALNNMAVFLMLLTGIFGVTAVTYDAGSPISLIISAAMLAGYAIWVLRLERKNTVAAVTESVPES